MITTNKLILCVAPTSNFHGKKANAALPEQPDEIAEDVIRCWNEGAAIVHIHARDKNGIQTNDAEVFREIDKRIREKHCDIIIQHSTAPAMSQINPSAEGGFDSLEPGPEMGSLNMGLGTALLKDREALILLTRSLIERKAKEMLERGIKPEMEVYHPGMMEDVYNLIEKGLLAKPYWISFVMGMHRVAQGTIRYTPKNLFNYMDLLPQEAMFSTLGIADAELPSTTMSILLGGHVRVGLEDNIHYTQGVLASNPQLVARIARIARELGREPATPDEARVLLGIPKLKQ